MRWTINQTKLDEAREILDITFPVRVRTLEDGLMGMAGKYHGLGHWGPTTEKRLEEPAHHISIASHLDAKLANKTLWHEMTHAAQCEDFLPEDNNYRIANKGLRKAFRDEMREIRVVKGGSRYGGVDPNYANVSFEVEARDVMDDSDKLFIVESTETEETTEDDDPLKGYRALWRVDVWDADKKFVATQYVLADDEWGAKRFARDKHLGKKWSQNVEAYPIDPQRRAK